MNRTYKVTLPKDEKVLYAKMEIRGNTVYVNVEVEDKWKPQNGVIYYARYIWNHVIIFDKIERDSIRSYVDLNMDDNHLSVGSLLCEVNDASMLRPATKKEKRLLFDALAKEGKMWDAQKKAVVDLPRWRAEKDCRYYYIKNCDADDNRFEVDNNFYESGNYFKTEETAERVAEQIREIFKNSKAE